MLDKETIVTETRTGGLKISCPDYGMSVEVDNTVTDYLRARQYIYLVSNHVLAGELKDCFEHFDREERF